MRGSIAIATHSSHSLGFYGATGISQRVALSTAAISTATVSGGVGGATSWGFATSTQGDQIVARINQIIATLVAYGLERGT